MTVVTQQDWENLQTHAEQATATLGLVLKACGGSVTVPRKLVEDGFVEGEFVNLSINEESQDMVVFVDGQ